jgi:hypothetical protein
MNSLKKFVIYGILSFTEGRRVRVLTPTSYLCRLPITNM